VGLDMYLSAKRYLAEYLPEEKILVQELNSALNSKMGSVTHVTIEVGYWRKANAIHRWFVRNIQDDLDECQESEVSLGQLAELQAIVDMVLNDKSLAHELLPTGEGFFFGGGEIDEYYIDRLQHTKEILDKILSNPDSGNWNFYYQASW
jgi:hypothetical protein